MERDENTSKITDKLLFTRLFQTFRIAIQPSKLIIALAAIAVICFAGSIMDAGKTVAAESIGTGPRVTELQIFLNSPERLDSFIKTNKENGQATGVFVTLWHFAREKFNGALNSLFKFDLPGVAANIGQYLRGTGWAVRYHTFYCVIFIIIKLAVIATAGGGICRISALQFARGEKQGISEAIRYSRGQFWSFFTTPIAPLAVIIFIGLFVFILGLLGNIPFLGELLMGIFMPLVLLAGVLIAIMLIGAFAGFNLMYPAIAYDGSDCFDAVSRAFNYVYSRPWRMGFYTAVAAIYGAICYIFVRFFAFLLLKSSWVSLRVGLWAQPHDKINKLQAIWPEPTFINLMNPTGTAASGATESVSAFLVYICLLMIVGLLVAFLFSFYFTANTIIYSLLRNSVDKTAIDDIYVPTEKPEATEAEQEKPEQSEPPEQQADKKETKKGKQQKNKKASKQDKEEEEEEEE